MLELCWPRRPAKQTRVAEWQTSRVAKKAIYLGKVEAADAEIVRADGRKVFDVLVSPAA